MPKRVIVKFRVPQIKKYKINKRGFQKVKLYFLARIFKR